MSYPHPGLIGLASRTILAATTSISMIVFAWLLIGEESCCGVMVARCTGSSSCSVCSNCSRCAHCKGGGSCGVCSRGSPGMSSGGSSGGSSSTTPYVSESEKLRKEQEKAKREESARVERARQEEILAKKLAAKVEADRLAAIQAEAAAMARKALEMFRLGQSLEKQGRPRGSLDYYRDLVDDYPDEPVARQAEARIAILNPPPNFRGQSPSPVIKVLDHRTFKALVGGKPQVVRLMGLAELPKAHSRSPLGPWEDQAKEFLGGLLDGQSVLLLYEPGHDRYDADRRLLAYAYREADVLFVNREVISRGYGIAFRDAAFALGEDFRSADARARRRKVGLWEP